MLYICSLAVWTRLITPNLRQPSQGCKYHGVQYGTVLIPAMAAEPRAYKQY